MANKKGKSADFIFLGSKITADCDCSHEIKRCLLLGRKAMTNLGGGGNESCSVVSDSLQPHGLYRKLSATELMLLNFGVEEDS